MQPNELGTKKEALADLDHMHRMHTYVPYAYVPMSRRLWFSCYSLCRLTSRYIHRHTYQPQQIALCSFPLPEQVVTNECAHKRNKPPAAVKRTRPVRRGAVRAATPRLLFTCGVVFVRGKSRPAAGSRASAAAARLRRVVSAAPRRFCAAARRAAPRDSAWERPSPPR